jgi:Flp pilus assembly pilin Flp
MHTRPTSRPAAPSRRRRQIQAGQGLVEYALILALIAILAIGATVVLGRQVSTTLSTVGAQIPASSSASPTAAPSVAPTPTPPSNFGTKKTCTAAGYTWVTTPKPAHCT